MRTVALRFAENFAPDEGTIAAHEAVIEQLGFVWYGKMGAAVSQKAAADLMSNEMPRILLIHSGGTRRFWAYIDAAQKETPELKGVPSYYRNQANDFGYWFRVRRFEAAPKDIMAQCTVPSSGNKLSIASRRSMSPYFIIDAPDD